MNLSSITTPESKDKVIIENKNEQAKRAKLESTKRDYGFSIQGYLLLNKYIPGNAPTGDTQGIRYNPMPTEMAEVYVFLQNWAYISHHGDVKTPSAEENIILERCRFITLVVLA